MGPLLKFNVPHPSASASSTAQGGTGDLGSSLRKRRRDGPASERSGEQGPSLGSKRRRRPAVPQEPAERDVPDDRSAEQGGHALLTTEVDAAAREDMASAVSRVDERRPDGSLGDSTAAPMIDGEPMVDVGAADAFEADTPPTPGQIEALAALEAVINDMPNMSVATRTTPPPPSPGPGASSSSPLLKVDPLLARPATSMHHVSLGGRAGGDVEDGEGVVVRPDGCAEEDSSRAGLSEGQLSRMGRGEKTDAELRKALSKPHVEYSELRRCYRCQLNGLRCIRTRGKGGKYSKKCATCNQECTLTPYSETLAQLSRLQEVSRSIQDHLPTLLSVGMEPARRQEAADNIMGNIPKLAAVGASLGWLRNDKGEKMYVSPF